MRQQLGDAVERHSGQHSASRAQPFADTLVGQWGRKSRKRCERFVGAQELHVQRRSQPVNDQQLSASSHYLRLYFNHLLIFTFNDILINILITNE